MTKGTSGIALVTVLSLTVVLMTVVGLLTAVAVSDLTQARSSIQQMQARAVAEGGEVFARYAIGAAAQPEIRNVLRAYMIVNVDSATEWAIPESDWADAEGDIQALLNGSYGGLAASEMSGLGSASISYNLRNFRGGTRSATAQSYFVDYAITSTGTANTAVRRVEDLGVFEIQIGKPSLSQYLFLVDNGQGNNGFYPTGARFNGPVHANSNWGFWGAPEFLDTITTSSNGAYFWNAGGTCTGGSPTWIEGDSRPPCTVPIFAKGFTRNAPAVQLPTSSLSQRRAALGLNPESASAVDNRTVCNIVRGNSNCSGNNLPPDGVYVVNDGSQITGGIYVQGNLAELELDAASRNGIQTYRFRQGTTHTVVELDFNSNTTTVTTTVGMTAPQVRSYSGVPNGPAPLGTGGPTGQIYVTGRIDTLEGPGRTGTVGSNPPDHPPPSQIGPALSLESELNITAENRIDLRSDIVYECDPTMLATPSYLAQYPRCDTGGTQLPTVLGVMSLTQDIRITTDTPDNLYLWGSYLAGTNTKGLTVENPTSRRAQGTLRLYGGVIQSYDQLRGRISGGGALLNGYYETFDYDLRFANGSVAPPNFPTVRTFDVQNVIPVKLAFREY